MSKWHDKLSEYRVAVEAARIVMNGFDSTSSTPGEKEKDLLKGISTMCNIAITRIDESNEAYAKEKYALND